MSKINFDEKKVVESMKKYDKLSNCLQNFFNEKTKNMLYFVFGSSENEIIEKLKNDYGVSVDEIVSIGYGGYIKKENVDKFNKINKYIKLTKKEFTNDYYNCCGLYLSRLWDYESRISFGQGYDDSLNDLLFYMGVDSVNDLDKELLIMLYLTENYYNKEFDRIN